MKIIIPQETLPVSRKRTHPHIDVGNGDGPLALPELSHEMTGGDWYDLGYFHTEQVADYAAHAMNLFPKVLAALQAVHSDLDLGAVSGGSTELSIMVDQTLAEAGELIHPTAAPAAPAAVKMTAAELLAKFPDMEGKHPSDEQESDSLLLDMACPACGQRDRFRIAFRGLLDVNDDTSDENGDHCWEATDECDCMGHHCAHSATVADFTFPGLDDLIAEQEEPDQDTE